MAVSVSGGGAKMIYSLYHLNKLIFHGCETLFSLCKILNLRSRISLTVKHFSIASYCFPTRSKTCILIFIDSNLKKKIILPSVCRLIKIRIPIEICYFHRTNAISILLLLPRINLAEFGLRALSHANIKNLYRTRKQRKKTNIFYEIRRYPRVYVCIVAFL